MKGFRLIMVLTVVLGIAGCLAAKHRYRKDPPLAQYNGGIKAPGLKGEAHVYRDEYAVPHVYADNAYDLFFAVGYAQAQDRLWEMVLLRALAEGRTAELLGRLKVPGASFKGFPVDTVMIDKQQRSVGFKFLGEVGAALLKEYSPEQHLELKAFSDGINHFIKTHDKLSELPVEFQVLQVKPAKWRPADVVTLGRLMGFILGYNMMVELWRYNIMEEYGEKIGWEIAPVHDAFGPTVVPPGLLHNKLDEPRDLPPGGRPSEEEPGYSLPLSAEAAKGMLAAFQAINKGLRADLPFASNNWVLSGKMTTTGTPMLANDTHLPHMQPCIWYMCRVKGAGYDSYGVMLPGTPYHALGHTRKLAWAATTSIADVQDLFVEKVDEDRPGRYLHQGEWKRFFTRKEKIKVRYGSVFREKEVEIRQSVHGPVVSDFLPLPEGTPPVALRWVAWDFARDLAVFEKLIRSKDVEEFMRRMRGEQEFELMNIAISLSMLMKGESIDDFIRAMDKLVLPNQNWAAADADGNIIYLPGGLVPVREKGLGAIPAPGTGEFDWTGFIPLMELPHMINPERGWIVSANNEAVDAEWYPYVFDLNYDSGWRAWRVQELILELAPIDMDDMRRIQNDVYVKKAEVEVPMILAAVEKTGADDPRVIKGYEQLKEWDYESDVDSTATAVFFKYAEEMRRNTFADELSEEDFEMFMSESHADISVELLLKKGESFLFDDVDTEGVVEDKDDIMVRSLGDAVAFMEERYGEDPSDWRWGEVHPMRFFHPLGFGPLRELSVGTWPHPGSRHTVRCASPAESGKWHFKATYGPAWRLLIDMGDPEHALGIIAGSISGQWLSPHYRDMHEKWVKGEHLTSTMDPEKVKKEARYHLVLSP